MTDDVTDHSIETPDVILAVAAYVAAIHREMLAENTAPTLGAQNQVVEAVLADTFLREEALRWAGRHHVEEASLELPPPPPIDEAYRRVRAMLAAAEGEAPPGSDRLRGPPVG